jgi:hypothetical protein
MCFVIAFLFPPLAQILCEKHKFSLFYTLPLCLMLTGFLWLPGVIYAITTAVYPRYKEKRAERILERFKQQKLRGEELSVE